MRKTPLIRPLYADRFQCIGPQCEDSCCVGWRVSIDEPTFQRYQAVEEGPLKVLMQTHVLRTEPRADSCLGAEFASVKMLDSGDCPFLTQERLCRIQSELGEDHLSTTCSNYPRTVHTIDELREQPLSLSCPEAARLVLLDPKLVDPNPASGHVITWDDRSKEQLPLHCHFWAIRDFVVRLVLNRNYALWQRLFLLGIFSRRLESLQRGELNRSFAELVDEFAAALGAGSLRVAMDAIQPDLGLQLSLLVRLLEMRAKKASRHAPRFSEVLEAFIQGIGLREGTGLEKHIALYQKGFSGVLEPFLKQHPHLLENFLLNQIFRYKFPVGDVDPESGHLAIQKMYEELVVQYAVIKGLLIGVAAHKGESFSVDDVVKVIQTASRHFEHAPKFLEDARALLSEKKMNDARGLTMLVRN